MHVACTGNVRTRRLSDRCCLRCAAVCLWIIFIRDLKCVSKLLNAGLLDESKPRHEPIDVLVFSVLFALRIPFGQAGDADVKFCIVVEGQEVNRTRSDAQNRYDTSSKLEL